MQGRVFGVETEYGAIAHDMSDGSRRTIDVGLSSRLVAQHTDGASSGFLTNGGRCYADVGGHPEYATPECDRIDDLVASVFAGHSIVNRARLGVLGDLSDEGRIASAVRVYFNNIDSGGATYGMHENFLVAGDLDRPAAATALAPLFGSLPILCGVGSIRRWVDGVRVQISPRGLRVQSIHGSSASYDAPMVKLQSDAHARRTGLGRLQVVCGESNPSEWALALRVGIIHLGLRLFEEAPELIPRRMPEYPLAAIRRFSDHDERARVPCNNRKTISALEIQELLLDAACRLVERHGALAEDHMIIDRWRTTLEAAQRGIEALAQYAAWAAKRVLVEGMLERGRNEYEAIALDYAFHTVDFDRNIAVRAMAREQLARVTNDDQILLRMQHPPKSTRARARADLLTLTEPKVTNCEWGLVRTQIGAQTLTVELPDPRVPDLPDLPDLIDRLWRGLPLLELPEGVQVRPGRITGHSR